MCMHTEINTWSNHVVLSYPRLARLFLLPPIYKSLSCQFFDEIQFSLTPAIYFIELSSSVYQFYFSASDWLVNHLTIFVYWFFKFVFLALVIAHLQSLLTYSANSRFLRLILLFWYIRTFRDSFFFIFLGELSKV